MDRQQVPCSGHGHCEPGGPAGPVCVCQAGPETGHFHGSHCQHCLPGYYGPQCLGQCPGDACGPCSGHGTCDDGIQGEGQCTCVAGATAGYWTGPQCDRCRPGHYGPRCAAECPGGATLPCGGHGACHDGRTGSGACACGANATHGHWAGATCSECAPPYYGLRCTARCPSALASVPCSGHGACSAGLLGTGACTCEAGYAGADCAAPCPLGPDGRTPCGGHGTCTAPPAGVSLAICECLAGASGHWAGPACSACAGGHAGPQCTLPCPLHCSGHGQCSAGLSGTGRCVCGAGFAGPRCDLECPGGAAQLCHGHGQCTANGTCDCVQDPQRGFWGGADCGGCQPPYSGPACLSRQCPQGDGGLPCSGVGVCRGGACLCPGTACGPTCALTGPDCPSAPAEGCGALCGAHGVCADGACYCLEGWSGPQCAAACAGSPPCHGHGQCGEGAVGCVCLAGYAGPSCVVECAGGWATPCHTQGQCRQGADGDGGCDCAPGYAGAACEHVCPQGPSGLCNGHGACHVFEGLCECIGNWAGAACGECAPYWSGPDCAAPCLHGAGSPAGCLCQPLWAGSGCTQRCDGVPAEGDGPPCSGHGRCNDTAVGDGTCVCDAGWRGAVCDVPCTGINTTGRACGGHGLCLPSGGCQCDASTFTGYWGGMDCAVCAAGWVGLRCDRTCGARAGSAVLCGGHGVCQPLTETCLCDDDSAISGVWSTASACTECEAPSPPLTQSLCERMCVCVWVGGCVCGSWAVDHF